jgi:hypothetical protein
MVCCDVNLVLHLLGRRLIRSSFLKADAEGSSELLVNFAELYRIT